MKKQFITFILIFLLPGSALSASALMVRFDKDRIWIRAEQIPLQTILRRVAEQGVKVRIDPQLNPRITVDLKDLEIQSGLSIILKSVNHVLIWETVPDASGSESRIAEVQVFEPGKKSRMIDLSKKTRFEILKNPEDGSFYVKDEIIVRMQPDAAGYRLTRLLEKINGTLLERDRLTGLYRIRLPENTDVPAAQKRIGSAPGVSQVEPNYAYPLLPPAQTPRLSDPDNESQEPNTEVGAAPIAILDSGIAPDTGLEALVVNSLNAVDSGDAATDSLGHGTQMAYIASGMIKPKGVDTDTGDRMPILPIKVFDENGYTSNYSIMQSIQFAVENEARVISLSWGSETRSRFLDESLQAAEARGLIVIASAGNKPTGKPVYPAAYDSVIGVGALTPDGKRWENSNFGDFVTLYAPGFGSFPVGYRGGPGSYAGTSISAAFAANVIADYLADHPDADKEQVLKMISDRSKKSAAKIGAEMGP